MLDEADEMLDLGFREELEAILETTPAERRTLLFSATIPKPIAALAKRYQRDALRIATTGEREAHGDIEYRALRIAPREREHAVVNVLRYFEARGALVFCATREGVRHLHANLLERGFSVVALSGELSQNERTRALQALRDGRARVCVATDVAARGLDLPDLGLVVHADLPQRPRDAAAPQRPHRPRRPQGRVRADRALHPPPPRRAAADRRQRRAPSGRRRRSADEIRAKDQERLLARARARSTELPPRSVAAATALLAGRSAEAIAAALIRLHRAGLPAPEELIERRHAPHRPARAPAGPRAARPPATSVWFRMNVGRARNADPRWLIPLICRRGHVTKQEIGIDPHLRPRDPLRDRPPRRRALRGVAARPDAEDASVRIEPLREARPRRASGPKGTRRQNPT